MSLRDLLRWLAASSAVGQTRHGLPGQPRYGGNMAFEEEAREAYRQPQGQRQAKARDCIGASAHMAADGPERVDKRCQVGPTAKTTLRVGRPGVAGALRLLMTRPAEKMVPFPNAGIQKGHHNPRAYRSRRATISRMIRTISRASAMTT